MYQNNKQTYQFAPTYLGQTFLYVVSPCMDILKVHIFNPNKNMQRIIFVQASRVNGTKYLWNKMWYKFILF